MRAEIASGMEAIDVHAHVFLHEVLGACGRAGPELGRSDGVEWFRAGNYTISGVNFSNSPMSDPAQRLALMERMGVSFQILSPYPMLFFYDQPADTAVAFARKHNDALARLVSEFPARFAGFATLPMQAPDAAVAELRRAVGELGLVGSYIGASFAERQLSDPELAPLWDEHVRQGVPVVVHPGPPSQALSAKAPSPWDLDLIIGFSTDETTAIAHLLLGGVLDRHPGLVAVIPHGGGFAPYVKSRFEMAIHKRAWGRGLLRRSFHEVWNQLVFDCLVHDEMTLEYLVRAHGAERVVLGTNFAAWDQDDHMIERLRSLPIGQMAIEAILSANAKKLFLKQRINGGRA